MDINSLRSNRSHATPSLLSTFLLGFIAAAMLIGTAGAQPAALSASEIQEFKNRVATQASSMQSLESDFVQLKHLDFVDNAIKSEGKLYFKSPHRIRWEYTSPFVYYVVFDDTRMFVNDGGNTKHVNLASNALLREINGLLAGTVQGDAIFDDKRFDIAYQRVEGKYRTTFTPKEKAMARYIKHIEMTFDPSSYLVTRIKIVEPSLDYTEINFSRQKRNTPIPDEKFLAR